MVFALAWKKFQKETRNIQQYIRLLMPSLNQRWLIKELVVILESLEVALDLVMDAMFDHVFGEKH